MRAAYLLPLRNIRQEDARADHMLKPYTGILQRLLYDFKATSGLGSGIANANRFTIGS